MGPNRIERAEETHRKSEEGARTIEEGTSVHRIYWAAKRNTGPYRKPDGTGGNSLVTAWQSELVDAR
jgi:hypothetical protein